MGKGGVGQIDEYALPVTQRRDAHKRPDRFDVAPGFADEATDVPVGELHLDGDGAAATLDGLYVNVIGLLGERLRDVLDERPVVNTWAGRTCRTFTPETAVV
jgi:hypothetical protein